METGAHLLTPPSVVRTSSADYAERCNTWAQNKLRETTCELERQQYENDLRNIKEKWSLKQELEQLKKESQISSPPLKKSERLPLGSVSSKMRTTGRRDSTDSSASSGSDSGCDTIGRGRKSNNSPDSASNKSGIRFYVNYGKDNPGWSNTLEALDICTDNEGDGSERGPERNSLKNSFRTKKASYEERSKKERLTNLHRRYTAQITHSPTDLQKLQKIQQKSD